MKTPVSNLHKLQDRRCQPWDSHSDFPVLPLGDHSDFKKEVFFQSNSIQTFGELGQTESSTEEFYEKHQFGKYLSGSVSHMYPDIHILYIPTNH